MKIPYSNPNLRVSDFLTALLMSEQAAEDRIKSYFSRMTGKKYILITNSCRSALFLAYRAIGKKGEVVTSPLTCKVAVDPIEASGNQPVFADINDGDLNLCPGDVARKITRQTMAVQAIHLGGVACDMGRIMAIAGQQGLWVIEDCAQSLGAKWQGKSAGSFGDIACFSLIKNAYGIGGGILATNDETIYTKARDINAGLGKGSWALAGYRIFRNLLDTRRSFAPVFLLYRFLMSVKKDRQTYDSVQGQLHRIRGIEKKIAAHQLSRWDVLHENRRKIGRLYYEHLVKLGLMKNCRFDPAKSYFTKLFVYHPVINSRKHIKMLNRLGIEAMHLEQKTGSPYQEKMIASEAGEKSGLKNYEKIHDCLISLPVFENMSKAQLQMVVNTFQRILSEPYEHFD
jgi:dTDP-4-amino-4,6-dideoxygalactose transaminase